jgi:predicted  nucleic acid-binding Zn-ribbon protein
MRTNTWSSKRIFFFFGGVDFGLEGSVSVVGLNTVKFLGVFSNGPYRALQSEIDAAKKEKVRLEDQVLVLMEQIENLQKASKAAEQEALKVKADLDGQDRALDAEEAQAKSLVDSKKVERDVFFAGLPADVRFRYEAIQRGRAGFVAVVPINDMVCGGCRTAITPNLLNQVMKGKEIITCEGCSRILYIVPKPPAPQAAPDSAPSPSGPAIVAEANVSGQ